MRNRNFLKIFIFSLCIFVFAVVICKVKAYRPNGLLNVVFQDVGNGSCTYIKLPNGKNMLIDSGNPENFKDIQTLLNKYNVKTIDYALCTHGHDDHIGAYNELAQTYEIKEIYISNMPETNYFYKGFMNYCRNDKTTINYVTYNDVIIDDEVTLTALAPYENEHYFDENDYSVVFRLTYKNIAILFMGDASSNVEMRLLKNKENLKSNVILLGHHGSKTSSAYNFLQAVSPDFAIASTGKDKYNSRPAKIILNYLEDLNIQFMSTLENSTITLTTDGEKITKEDFHFKKGD